MYLPPFEYVRPTSVDEAVQTLAARGEDASVYMGGTELLLLMKLGLAEPRWLVDCKWIDDLHQISITDGSLVIGAAVTHREVEHSTTVREVLPSLAELVSAIGNVRVRSMGTLVGNLCFADPHSDPPTLLLALGASVRLRSAGGARELRFDEFVTGPYETALQPGELLVGVSIPLPVAGTAIGYERIAFRERPVLNVAVCREGERFRVAVGGGGRSPRLSAQGAALLDAGTTPSAIDAAAEQIATELDPVADLDGDAGYKRQLARVVFRRAVERVAG